jgi:hypothetical protein
MRSCGSSYASESPPQHWWNQPDEHGFYGRSYNIAPHERPVTEEEFLARTMSSPCDAYVKGADGLWSNCRRERGHNDDHWPSIMEGMGFAK